MRSFFKWLDSFTLRLGAVSGFMVLLAMLVIVADVAGRSLVNKPLPGATELAVLFLVSLIFLGLAAAQHNRQHYIVDLVINLLEPRLKRWVEIITLFLSLIVVGVFAWYSGKQAWLSTLQSEVGYGSVAFPIWPARGLIAFGFVLLALQFVSQIFRLLDPNAAQRADPTQSQE